MTFDLRVKQAFARFSWQRYDSARGLPKSHRQLFILHTADMAENGIRVRDSLADLERYRLQLEQNVAKLRASLGHWQTWEIEYEGMKEEILELGEVHSSSDLVYGVALPGM